MAGSSGATIGGTAAGQANVIANNAWDGVAITSGTGHTVSGNSIYSNGDLGIDIGNNGVTANDAGDIDVGTNNGQNFPLLTAVSTSSVSGTLNSTPSRQFRIELFASPTSDGEGQRYLGSVLRTTDASGFASFTVAVTAALGEWVTATATDTPATGDTSEFSAAVQVNSAPVNSVPAGPLVVNEDTPLAIGSISVSDLENNLSSVALTVVNGTLGAAAAGGAFVTGGGTGALTITGSQAVINLTLANLVYQGNLDYSGADTLTVTSTDGGGAQDVDAIAIAVNSVNDAPAASNVTVNGNEDDAQIAITLTGADVEGPVASFRIVGALPANGTLYTNAGLTTVAVSGIDYAAAGNALTLYFVPTANWNGSTGFQFTATDGGGLVDPSPATATINVAAVNDAPLPDNVVANGNEDDAQIAITLTGTDVDGSIASFRLAGLPANGLLYTDAGLTTLAAAGIDYAAAGNALTLYFVPTADWNGSTGFQYTATDSGGLASAAAATATINVTPINDAPAANDVVANGNEDDAQIAITLTAADVEGPVAFFRLASLPANGVLYTDPGLTTAAAVGPNYAAVGNALTLYFVPAANWNGSTGFQFTATDAGGLDDASPATATINVAAVNDQPIANDATANGNEDDAQIAITLTGSDVEGPVASFRIVGALPANGTLYTNAALTTVAVSGIDYAAAGNALTLYFVPAADWNGSTGFQFTATDGGGLSDAVPANATINVAPVNDVPTTNNVVANGIEDDAQIAVTLTGADVEGPVASFRIVGALPTNGTLYTDAGLTTVAVSGIDYAAAGNALTLYFVPAASWNGSTGFQFTATDGGALVDPSPATATINVASANDEPVANDVVTNGNEDDAQVAITLTGSDLEGPVASFRLAGLPANGVLYTDAGLTTLAAAGIDYAAAGNALTLYFVPAANWNGSTGFQFTATDGAGLSDATPANATINVAAVNDEPIANGVVANGNEDDAQIAITLTATDIEGPVATFRLANLPANGTLYTDAGLTSAAAVGPNYAAVGSSLTLYFVPAANWNGSTGFQFTATDAGGLDDATPATATINVAGVNDEPAANDVVANGNEDDAQIAITLTAADVEGPVASFRITSGLPANGTLYTDALLTTVAVSGIDYAAAGNALTLYFVPVANWNGSTGFQFTATDGGGLSDATAATATINVAGVNDEPAANDVVANGNEDDAQIAITLTAADVEGPVATFRLLGLPVNGLLYTDAGLTTLAASGFDYAAAGSALTLYFVPAVSWNGSTGFQFTATDGGGLSDATPATATINVAAANDEPVASDVVANGNEDDAQIAITLTASDIDGPIASFRLLALPANGLLYTDASLTTLAAAATDYAAAGNALTLYFVPAANWNGTTGFQFTATDGAGLSDATPATATINVAAVNDAPVANNVTVNGNEDDAQIAITLTAGDVEGPVASFRLANLPANGTLYTDAGLTIAAAVGPNYAAVGSSLTLYFVPAANWNGSTGFQFTATDGGGLDDATPATATINVAAVNDAPVANNATANGNEDDAQIAITLTGSDVEGPVASFRLAGLPGNGTLYTDAGLTITAAAGIDYAAAGNALTLYFVPAADWNGSTGFQFTATDGGSLSDATPATATINVAAVNDEPAANDVTANGTEDDAQISITLTATDVEGPIATFRVTGPLPANGTLYTDAGLTTVAVSGIDYAAAGSALTLYFVPAASWNGSTSFQFTATDGGGLSDATPATATINVAAANDEPVANDVTANGNEDDAQIAVTLTASDIDGPVASFRLAGLPGNGTLYTDAGLTTLAAAGIDYAATGNALTLHFVPAANWNGSTGFQFTATDGGGLSDATPATATINVAAVNDAPAANDVTANGNEDDAQIAITLTGADVEGPVASFRLVGALPANGTLYTNAGLTTVAVSGIDYAAAGNALTLYFVPTANWNGSTGFQFTATDGGGLVDPSPATATINVAAANDEPIANDVTVNGNEDDAQIAITLTGSDVEGRSRASASPACPPTACCTPTRGSRRSRPPASTTPRPATRSRSTSCPRPTGTARPGSSSRPPTAAGCRTRRRPTPRSTSRP